MVQSKRIIWSVVLIVASLLLWMFFHFCKRVIIPWYQRNRLAEIVARNDRRSSRENIRNFLAPHRTSGLAATDLTMDGSEATWVSSEDDQQDGENVEPPPAYSDVVMNFVRWKKGEI